MARNLREIYNQIISTKVTREAEDDTLSDLKLIYDAKNTDKEGVTDYYEEITAADSPSAVSEWKLIYWVVAFAIWSHEKLWDVFMTKAEKLERESRPGTLAWYKKKILAYDKWQIEVEEGKYENAIQYASLEDDEGMIRIKLSGKGEYSYEDAKGNSHTRKQGFTKLSMDSDDGTNFKDYFQEEIVLAGVQADLTSRDPDEITLRYKIYYDNTVKEVLKEKSKTLDQYFREKLDLVIQEYMLHDMPTSGILSLTKLTDVIQTIKYIKSPVLVRENSDESLATYFNTGSGEKIGIDEYFKPLSGGINFKLDLDMQPYSEAKQEASTLFNFNYTLGYSSIIDSIFGNEKRIKLKNDIRTSIQDYLERLTTDSEISFIALENYVRATILGDPDYKTISSDASGIRTSIDNSLNIYDATDTTKKTSYGKLIDLSTKHINPVEQTSTFTAPTGGITVGVNTDNIAQSNFGNLVQAGNHFTKGASVNVTTKVPGKPAVSSEHLYVYIPKGEGDLSDVTPSYSGYTTQELQEPYEVVGFREAGDDHNLSSDGNILSEDLDIWSRTNKIQSGTIFVEISVVRGAEPGTTLVSFTTHYTIGNEATQREDAGGKLYKLTKPGQEGTQQTTTTTTTTTLHPRVIITSLNDKALYDINQKIMEGLPSDSALSDVVINNTDITNRKNTLIAVINDKGGTAYTASDSIKLIYERNLSQDIEKMISDNTSSGEEAGDRDRYDLDVKNKNTYISLLGAYEDHVEKEITETAFLLNSDTIFSIDADTELKKGITKQDLIHLLYSKENKGTAIALQKNNNFRLTTLKAELGTTGITYHDYGTLPTSTKLWDDFKISALSGLTEAEKSELNTLLNAI